MTKIGWVVLAGILLVAAAFASMLSLGSSPPTVSVSKPMSLLAAVPPVWSSSEQPILQVPVAGVSRSQIVDTWGATRSGGRGHKGNDIMAPGGTPVFAVAPGTVAKLFQSRLGGTTLYQRSPDGQWVFYYAHLMGYAPGLREGQLVNAGDLLGFVGDTGDAGAGNYHLHFSTTRVRPEQKWYEGEDVNPYPMLAGR